MKNITLTILQNLIANEEYARKVLPFLKEEYFENKNQRIVFKEISSFALKYSKLPTKTSLEVELDNRKDLTEQQYKDITNLVNTVQDIEAMLIDILEDKTNTTFTESEIDDHKHKLANLLEDNGVYEMVRNRERSDYYEQFD